MLSAMPFAKRAMSRHLKPRHSSNNMDINERIERLENLYDKVYHDYELLSVLIPRLTDILIRYWGTSTKHRDAIMAEINGIRSFTQLTDNDLQTHFKGHKEKPLPYSNIYNYIYSNIKEDGDSGDDIPF